MDCECLKASVSRSAPCLRALLHLFSSAEVSCLFVGLGKR